MPNILTDLKGTKPLVIGLIVLLTFAAILLLRKVGGMPITYVRKVPLLGEVFALAIAFGGAAFLQLLGKGVL